MLRAALVVLAIAAGCTRSQAETKWCLVDARSVDARDFRGCHDLEPACERSRPTGIDVWACRRVEKPWCYNKGDATFDCLGSKPACEASAAHALPKPAVCVHAWPAEMAAR